MPEKETMLKIFNLIIFGIATYSSTKNFNKTKKAVENLEDSKSMNVLLEYMNNCETRILYLLLFIIMQNITMAINN